MIAAWTVLLYASGVTALQSALRNVRQSTSLAVEGEIISISAPVRSHEQLVELGLNLDEYPDDNYRHILGVNDLVHAPSKLQKICQIRMKDVAHSKLPLDVHGCGIDRSFYISEDDMVQDIHDFDEVYGKPFNLMDRIASVYPSMAIAAEFKRASPSKGDINPNVDVVQQTLQYADVGSAVISVLTEFKHFKGTLEDMKKVRLATQAKYKDKRPAILRKDFILDRYQLYEARAHGADTVLLIVAVLGVNQLKDLIARARGLGMEPLVEVHTQQEMTIALDCGAKVIGVNNRNLHTFQLDLETTAKAISVAQARGVSWRPQGHGLPDIFIAALSGITSSDDVSLFRDLGVSCCLIGETLMKSSDPGAMVRQLLGESSGRENKGPLVKVCGVTRDTDASVALQNGANFIGVIFAPKSPRRVTVAQAQEVAHVVQKYGERTAPLSLQRELDVLRADRLSPKLWFSRAASLLEKITLRRPLLVGVFQDQSVEEVNEVVRDCGLDIVQLHGQESAEEMDRITVPCIKVVHVSPDDNRDRAVAELSNKMAALSGRALAVIMDTSIRGDKAGGTGVTFDWSIASAVGLPVFLAGGLSPINAIDAAKVTSVIGLDVSSGVEVAGQPGIKDTALVEAFLRRE